MSAAICTQCHVIIDTDDDPESACFREDEFWCEECREKEGAPCARPFDHYVLAEPVKILIGALEDIQEGPHHAHCGLLSKHGTVCTCHVAVAALGLNIYHKHNAPSS